MNYEIFDWRDAITPAELASLVSAAAAIAAALCSLSWLVPT